jgi:hypothetical protein
MDILFIALSPIDATFSASFRNRAVIKGFIELGHTVNILTVYSYDQSIIIDETECINELEIIRLDKMADQNDNSQFSIVNKGKKNILTKIVRSIYHRIFPFDSSFFLLKNIDVNNLPKNQYDIVISSSDPKTSHLAALRLFNKGLKAGKWIQYWGDPLTFDMTSRLIYPKLLVKKIEFNIIKRADKIIYVSPLTKIEQAELFRNISEKMSFIPIPYEKAKLFSTTNNKKYIIGYHGFYIKAVRNIIPLYDAVNNMNDNVQLDIVGSSDMSIKCTGNVKVYPNTNKIEEFESKTDLFAVVLNLHGNQLPGKLFHLAATNRPILVILDGERKGEVKKYLEGFGRFIICENNEDSISSTVYKTIKENVHFEPCKAFKASVVARGFLNDLSE